MALERRFDPKIISEGKLREKSVFRVTADGRFDDYLGYFDLRNPIIEKVIYRPVHGTDKYTLVGRFTFGVEYCGQRKSS